MDSVRGTVNACFWLKGPGNSPGRAEVLRLVVSLSLTPIATDAVAECLECGPPLLRGCWAGPAPKPQMLGRRRSC